VYIKQFLSIFIMHNERAQIIAMFNYQRSFFGYLITILLYTSKGIASGIIKRRVCFESFVAPNQNKRRALPDRNHFPFSATIEQTGSPITTRGTSVASCGRGGVPGGGDGGLVQPFTGVGSLAGWSQPRHGSGGGIGSIKKSAVTEPNHSTTAAIRTLFVENSPSRNRSAITPTNPANKAKK
jgi:hypothetical protein